MPACSSVRVPKLRCHTGTGQGYVRLNGRFVYLGRYGDPATEQKYHRLVAEWLATGRQAPVDPEQLLVRELIARYALHAEQYYRRPDGSQTTELGNIVQALKPLKELYADVPAKSFGPKALIAVRQAMVARRWCRKSVNKHIGRIKAMFRWATEQELIPGDVYHALQAVSGLRYGRCDAPENPAVRPVPIEQVLPLEPHVSKQVWAMIQLQLLTGARAGEVMDLRPQEVDRSGPVWVYTPTQHKTLHHGHVRRIYLGPKAQEVLQPFLLRPSDKPCFSPAEAEEDRRRRAHAQRRTPLHYGNRPGTNRVDDPQRVAGDHYDVASYRRAIARACDDAFPAPEPLGQRDDETFRQWQARLTSEQRKQLRAWQGSHRWHPHQLRHTAATELRKQFGLEAARVVLGHRSAAVTEIYAEIDQARAVEAIARVG